MYSTLFKNRISKSRNGFLCNLCDVEVAEEEKIIDHINSDESHLQFITECSVSKNFKTDERISHRLFFNGIIPINSKVYDCKLCSCRLTKLDLVFEHISGKKHKKNCGSILNLEDESIPAKFINTVSQTDEEPPSSDSSLLNTSDQVDGDDRVINGKNVCNGNNQVSNIEEGLQIHKSNQQSSSLFQCLYCDALFKSASIFSYHNMFHLSQKNCFISDIISFFVKGSLMNIYCLVCDLIMRSEEALESHLLSMHHRNRMMILLRPDGAVLMNMMCSTIYPVLGFPHPVNTFNGAFSSPSSDHLLHGITNQYTLSTGEVLPQLQQSMQLNNVGSYLPVYPCFICNLKYVNENLFILHCTSDPIHKYRMTSIHYIIKDEHMKFVSYVDKEVLRCMKCQIEFSDLYSASAHLFDFNHIYEHMKSAQLMVNNAQVVSSPIVSSILYKCPVCKLETPTDAAMAQHLVSSLHKNKVEEYYGNVYCDTFEKLIFSCPPCGTNFFHDKELVEHFQRFHSESCKDLRYPNGEVIGHSSSQNQMTNMVPHSLNRALENLMNLDMKGHKKQKAPHSRNQLDNQENGKETDVKKIRTQNLIVFSPRYIKLCLETGEENIFKVHPERMRKLELSISLTYPYKTNRGCIPCGCEISSDLQLLYEHLRSEEHDRNLQEMEDNHEFFENHTDQFSDLDLAKSYMYEDSEEWVSCLVCDIKVENNDGKVGDHINSKSHIDHHQSWKDSASEISKIFFSIFENLWYYIEKFFCNICSRQFDFEVDFARHLENSQHFKEVEKRMVRGQILAFDFCILCSSFWYAICDHHSIHCSKDSHKYILKTRDFTVPVMPDLAKNMLRTVNKIMSDLVTESNETVLHGKKIEETLLNSIKLVVSSKYPNAEAHLFGSRVSSLSFPDGDLDIYLDCEGEYKLEKSDDDSLEQIIAVQECFHKFYDIWMIEEIIIKTRVPIIKLRHRATNLNCDISFNNGLSVEKSKILGYFVEAYPPSRSLILFMKKWTNLCRLTGKKSFTSFAISWLVVFFLQIEEILPSVQSLMELENESRLVAGWETGVSKIIPVKDTNRSVGDLLRDFFLFYSKFDYISDVICPFLGKVMKKSQFSDIDHLPEEMHIYKTQIKKGNIEFFRLDSPMCIQEPIDLSQNLAKAVTKLHLRMFREYCSKSTEYLKNCS
ncbi:hypothetical protein QAD02_001899 [Eretmocerus hayati]|uniref:Uncharacterized protein n=1 Tax=Eretmocerus hayati TaxID=131215 RepID=A0ACC2NHK6_9HYME|nr:hypothetical protein QAD02_001899 [Eretmocerus hayati]